MERPAEPGVFCFRHRGANRRQRSAPLERCFANTRRLVFPHPSTYLAATDVLFEDRSLVAPGPETELDQGAFTVEPGLFFHQSADL